MTTTLTILGAPRTKKNSLRVLRGKGGRPFVAQSKQAGAWEEIAVLQLRSQWNRLRGLAAARGPLAGAVNLRAAVYRDRDGRADLLNYLAAVSDALERAGVVEDDSQVAGVDGSRLFVDRKNPRVEITLTMMGPQ